METDQIIEMKKDQIKETEHNLVQFDLNIDLLNENLDAEKE